LPTLDGVDIQLYTDQSQDQKDLKTLCMELEGILGEKIYGFDNENLETVIANTLIDSKLTISVAESCTGGLISNRLTDIPGSSGYFLSGIVTYSNKSKINFLDVNPKTIQSFGAVSHETAKEMAVGIRKKNNSNIGLSTTGIAGPTGETVGKPIGTLFVGISFANTTNSYKFIYNRNRLINKRIFSQFALNRLRLELQKHE